MCRLIAPCLGPGPEAPRPQGVCHPVALRPEHPHDLLHLGLDLQSCDLLQRQLELLVRVRRAASRPPNIRSSPWCRFIAQRRPLSPGCGGAGRRQSWGAPAPPPRAPNAEKVLSLARPSKGVIQGPGCACWLPQPPGLEPSLASVKALACVRALPLQVLVPYLRPEPVVDWPPFLLVGVREQLLMQLPGRGLLPTPSCSGPCGIPPSSGWPAPLAGGRA